MEHVEVRPGLRIQFWGVRGSTPTADEDKIGIGGNTPCIAVQYANEPLVIIDAGTGLRCLGQHLNTPEHESVRVSILFSHFHWDHIQGLPFFPLLYSERAQLDLYSGVPVDALRETLEGQMKEPYFPVPFAAAQSRRVYIQVQAQGCEIGSLSVLPVKLNHPSGATGYRINSPEGSIIYVSDHEHGRTEIDDRIANDASGSDLMVYDAHFTPDEYPQFKGWGHSTWLEATKLANRAGVGRLLLFHHSPSRTDTAAQLLLAQARHEFSSTDLARENHEISLAPGIGAGASEGASIV
jgi:phosphoribosyl 1,2-cyclic phosphodiesterase